MTPRSFSYYLSLHCYRHHRALHSFPTRRSSDLSAVNLGARLAAPERHFASVATSKHRRRSTASTRSTRNLQGKHGRSEEHTSELQSRFDLVCRLLLEKKK